MEVFFYIVLGACIPILGVVLAYFSYPKDEE